jgi:hypothetical protein
MNRHFLRMGLVFALSILSFFVLAQSPKNKFNNLVENPEFEMGVMNREKPWLFIHGWGAGGGGNNKEVIKLIEIDENVKFSGQRSIKLDNSKIHSFLGDSKKMRNKFASIMSINMPLKPGKIYNLSFWAKGSKDSLKFETTFDTWYKGISEVDLRFFEREKEKLTQKWAKYSYKFKTSEKGDKNYDPKVKVFWIQFMLLGNGIAWIDSVTIK